MEFKNVNSNLCVLDGTLHLKPPQSNNNEWLQQHNHYMQLKWHCSNIPQTSEKTSEVHKSLNEVRIGQRSLTD